MTADHAEAATQAQAGDSAAPGDVLDVEVSEGSDTATMGAAGAVTGQALGLANTEEQYRAPHARGYHGGDGFFGDRRAGALPMDAQSRAARTAFWLKEQPGLFDARGLAAGGQPRYALAVHVDEQHQEHVFAHSNIGPGVFSKPLPLGVWPAWDLVMDPANQDRGVLVRMLGHADPVHGLVAHYLQRRNHWAAHGARYHLAGIATTYEPTEPETLRRLIQPLNDHVSDTDAPFFTEAQGPLVEPEGGSMHPLQHVAPGLYVALAKVLATPWAGEARAQALDWVASIVEGSMAEDRPPFAAMVAAIRDKTPLTPEALGAVSQDGAEIAAQTARNLNSAMSVTDDRRQQSDFFGYLLCHRALVGLTALHQWERSREETGHGFVTDIAYLAVKANQDDPGFAARLAEQLPDPDRSHWKPR